MRVQIPVYTDRWMMGDRYGVVTKVQQSKRFLDPYDPRGRTLYYVKLDKSGKTIKVIADDCTEVGR